MDPTLATLALGSSVWVICERHRIAQQGTIVTVGLETFTVKLPYSSLPPQRYDKFTGMWKPDLNDRKRDNTFFIRAELPPRFLNHQARPPYVVLERKEPAHAAS